MAKHPTVISIANQKGGVGKTTTVVNLAAGLALRGYRVLVLDFDIQANATHILHRALAEEEPSMAEVLLEEVELDDIIFESNAPGVWVAPSGETMVRVDLALAGVLGREESLKRSLEESETVATMDFVLIDTSPYLGLLTVNALVASDQVIVPVSCEYLPMLGLRLFLGTVRTIQRRLNSNLKVLGYLLSMFDRRERITFDVERTMRSHFKDLVFKRPIRVNTHHKASPAQRQTIYQYEPPSGRGVEDYNWLTQDVLERLDIPQYVPGHEPPSPKKIKSVTKNSAKSTDTPEDTANPSPKSAQPAENTAESQEVKTEAPESTAESREAKTEAPKSTAESREVKTEAPESTAESQGAKTETNETNT